MPTIHAVRNNPSNSIGPENKDAEFPVDASVSLQRRMSIPALSLPIVAQREEPKPAQSKPAIEDTLKLHFVDDRPTADTASAVAKAFGKERIGDFWYLPLSKRAEIAASLAMAFDLPYKATVGFEQPLGSGVTIRVDGHAIVITEGRPFGIDIRPIWKKEAVPNGPAKGVTTAEEQFKRNYQELMADVELIAAVVKGGKDAKSESANTKALAILTRNILPTGKLGDLALKASQDRGKLTLVVSTYVFPDTEIEMFSGTVPALDLLGNAADRGKNLVVVSNPQAAKEYAVAGNGAKFTPASRLPLQDDKFPIITADQLFRRQQIEVLATPEVATDGALLRFGIAFSIDEKQQARLHTYDFKTKKVETIPLVPGERMFFSLSEKGQGVELRSYERSGFLRNSRRELGVNPTK